MHAFKLLLLLIVLATYGAAKQPTKAADSQNKPNTQEHNSDGSPSILEQTSPNKAESKANGGAQYEQQVGSISPTTIGIGTIIVYSLQFIALVATWWTMIRNGRRELRAYVLPESAGILDGSTVNPPQPQRIDFPFAAMLIKNGGRTPAYGVLSWWQIAVIPVKDEQNSLPVIPPMREAYSNTLGGGGTFHKTLWMDRPLTQQEITDIQIGVRAIYIYGRIEYRDVFKKKRYTNFRLHYSGQWPPSGNSFFGFSERGNDAN